MSGRINWERVSSRYARDREELEKEKGVAVPPRQIPTQVPRVVPKIPEFDKLFNHPEEQKKLAIILPPPNYGNRMTNNFDYQLTDNPDIKRQTQGEMLDTINSAVDVEETSQYHLPWEPQKEKLDRKKEAAIIGKLIKNLYTINSNVEFISLQISTLTRG